MLLWLSSRVLSGEQRFISVRKISVEVERAFESRDAGGVYFERCSHFVQIEPSGGSGVV
jgi:hypothetical protein